MSKYVWQTLIPESYLTNHLKKYRTKAERRTELSRLKEVCNEASTIVFIFLINKFFTEGSKAAMQAVDTFGELKIEGFYIGNSYFSGRNEKVMQGEVISKQLLSSIADDSVRNLITNSNYVSEILDKYRKLV